ncbi:MobV family relaxase [Clostridioides difficile]|uniref:MobV family relaxase n=22 Tax=Clostridioides difficile TaxID=1496 RepID=UPI000307A51B|nr:MobV family relaxase [Clostridioides difficile]ERM32516.1 plasmid recombination enzyme family protein [Clostridioides difficile P64]MBH6942290.1 plasmid recombination protein [Clostridioides difficile]MBH7311305.1 plasmid recombination protein [Clostridioides difficile]MBH7796056.1 plasmid recombination protein [Clostridioides difficile]MBH7954932.1 plasmid recombination protein [Clostridioides difficile]
MAFLVCHVAKYSRNNIVGIQKHNQRQNKSYKNKDIDITKSNKNIDFENKTRIKYLEKVEKIIKENRTKGKVIRKDAILMCENVISASPEFFLGMEQSEKEKYFKYAYEFLKDRYGDKNIVSATVHFDETTPHMHFNFVPITSDGKLSARDLITRIELKKIQNELPRFLQSKGFNIKRGHEHSKARHMQPEDYKKQQIQELNELENKLEYVKKLFKGFEKPLNSFDELEPANVKKSLITGKETVYKNDYDEVIDILKGTMKENLELKEKLHNEQLKTRNLEVKLSTVNEYERLTYEKEKKLKLEKEEFEEQKQLISEREKNIEKVLENKDKNNKKILDEKEIEINELEKQYKNLSRKYNNTIREYEKVIEEFSNNDIYIIFNKSSIKEIQENDTYRFKDANSLIKVLNERYFNSNETKEIGFNMSFGANNENVFLQKNIILGQYIDIDLRQKIIISNRKHTLISRDI